MTIAAAYLTSEGVVLGADSTTVILGKGSTGKPSVRQLFNYTQKVFEIGAPGAGRMGMCTWGSGKLGSMSHRTIVARLSDMVERDECTVDEAADKLIALVSAAANQATAPVETGYFLGGCDLETHDPSCYLIVVRSNATHQKEELHVGDVRFAGAPRIYERTFRGFDPGLPLLIRDRLKVKLQSLPADFDQQFDAVFQDAIKGLSGDGHRDLPLREAIDFVHAYLHITIKAIKFRSGVAFCGGPIEVGFVSTDRRFRWVRHKEFDVAILEQERGDP